jgi:hypothetical protein
MMTLDEYAKYIVDNMGRATLTNALTISSKFDTEYNFNDLLISMQKYISTLIDNDKFNKDKCYNLFSAISQSLKKYRSNVKYNKLFIYNDFIIDIWRIFNGD